MRTIRTTPRFERRLGNFIDKHPELERVVVDVMQRIATGKNISRLRVHALKGPLANCHAARISYEYRVVFILEAKAICFIDIGTHDDVY